MLRYMGQFVCQQVCAVAKEDILSYSECGCVDLTIETVSLRSRVDADAAEVGAETRFETAAHASIEHLAAATRILYRRFHRRGNLFVLLLRSGQKPLHIPVAVLSLKPQE
jgi:hypothetical protein